ncbi:hypothetical protein Tco_1517591 [Tanacetum coccineum]
MITLAEFMIVAGAENRPPMLDKAMYNSWESRMLLYLKGKKNDECDVQATNIVLQDLPPDLHALVNYCHFAKDIWERVKLLMKGTELSYQERECKLYNEFGKFTSVKGETLHEYYLRFAQLINDMLSSGMTMQQVQLYAYLGQHEGHANEVQMLRERYSDPLALVANHQILLTEFPQLDSDLAVLVFLPRDDPNACLNKAMTFMSTIVASRSKGIAKGSGGEVHMARQCTQPKRPRNATLFKEKLMLAEAHESGQVLDEEQLVYLADPGIANCLDVQPTIIHNAAFQTNDLDAYDSDCDDISSLKLRFRRPLRVHICVNSLATLTNYAKIEQDYIDEYTENLVLRAELAKKEHMIEKKFFDEIVLRCSRLKNRYVNLEIKLQHQNESFLNNKSLNNQDAPKIQEFFNINEWQAMLNAKDASIANLRKHIESLKGKNVIEKDATPYKA